MWGEPELLPTTRKITVEIPGHFWQSGHPATVQESMTVHMGSIKKKKKKSCEGCVLTETDYLLTIELRPLTY